MNSYPLSWPISWHRAGFRQRSNFQKVNGNRRSVAESVDEVLRQLALLGASSVVISTNLRLRIDGLPRSDQANPSDPGVAVYFKLKGADRVLACDRWDRIEDNIWAIAKHVDATRGQARWGVGTVEQAFAGYAALPAGGDEKPWWQVLGMPAYTTNKDEISAAWKHMIRNAHPDAGGSEAEAAAINAARDEGLRLAA